MTKQQVLVLSTNQVSFTVSCVLSQICYDPTSPEDPLVATEYKNVYEALVDGWKLLGSPIKEYDLYEKEDYYSWWLAKDVDVLK